MAGNYVKKKKSGKKKFLIALCCVLTVLLVIAVAAFAMLDSILDGINRFESGYSISDATPSKMDVINILLVGQDRREGQERSRSDSMILCTVNKTTKTLTMTSFMRDVWVTIPGYYDQRLNVPYMLGGFDLLNDTLEYNFGVRADFNVEMDFSGFMSMIDLVGGVDIELTREEADYLNRRGNWDIEANQGWTLTEGVNHLTGSQALAYSRIRAIGDDFGRTSRQRTVITALIDQAKTMNPKELYKLVEGVMPLLSTDMSNQQILGLAVEMVPLLSDIQIVSQRVPMDGEYSFATIDGASVIVLSESNIEVNKQLLEEAMKIVED